MRRITIATVLIIAALAAGGYLYLTQPFNPDRAELQEHSEAFMEDLQFKDFHSSAQYHHELEQERVDIGRAIEELFLVDPELLDILDYRITRTEIDSSGTRGRVLVNTRFRPLKPEALSDDDGDDIEEADLQLYWMHRHPDCPLGTDCEDNVCVDDAGQQVMKDDESVDHDDERVDEPFDCDPRRDDEWFMNLDSTLEQRDYR